MKITQLLTPIAQVQWLATTDTVRDAFDHMETHELTAAPLLDWKGRYIGTVTEADLRRHVAGIADRVIALATPLTAVERRSHNTAVTVHQSLASIVEQASGHCFVPVIDDGGKLLGIVDRRRIVDRRLPSAA